MKMRQLFWIMFAGFSALALQGAGFTDFSFKLLDLGAGHGQGKVEAVEDGSGFRMTVENCDVSNYAVACADFQYSGFAQQRLVFRMKGAAVNGAAKLSVSIAHRLDDGRWQGRSVGGIATKDDDFKTVVLGFDRDFQFPDARYEFVQLKFGFGGGAQGTVSQLEIRDVRIVNAEELNAGGSSDPVVTPLPLPPPPGNTGAFRLFFDFDNDDLSAVAQCRRDLIFEDTVSPNSFAVQLLKGTEGIFQLVRTPEEADVIVSSRTVPGKDGAAIAAASASRPVVIFGEAADPQLRAVAPMVLNKRKIEGFAAPEEIRVVADDEVAAAARPQRPLVRYYDSAVEPQSRVLLAYPDGTAFLAARGNVLQFAAGIAGQGSEVSPVFYDKGLLRLLLQVAGMGPAVLDERESRLIAERRERNGRLVRECLAAAGLPKRQAGKWQAGMSQENVGRFGYLVGESLLHCAVSRDLAVSNGSGVFRLFCGSSNSLSLPVWTCRVAEGAVALPEMDDVCTRWSGEGVVEYRATLPFDPAWKNRELFFEVREGIDDTDELYLNGRKIGGTDEKTPYYWIAPRRYAIPQSAVNYSGENELVLRVRNLRGEAGLNSKPLLSWNDGSAPAPKLTVTAVDWTGKTYRLDEAGRSSELQFSLLSPFVRYDFPEAEELTFSQENLADFAALELADGIRITPLDGENAPLYDRTRDGRLAGPEVMLFRNRRSRPFLLVFQHAPEAIVPRYRGKLLEGFTVRWAKGSGAGEMFAGWPFGISEIDTAEWKSGLSPAVVSRMREAAGQALTYPVGCDEIFALDRKKGTVEILNRFRFRKCADDWNTPRREVATLPPLAAWLYRQKRLVTTVEKLTDLGIGTNLGPTFGKAGNTIRYTLPLPAGEDFIPVGVHDGELFSAANRYFADGVKYSSGGGNPFAAWTPQHPYGTEIPNHGICPFRWNFGMGTALQSLCTLTEDNLAALRNRVRLRHVEPLALYQYKFFARHRQEPFSGLQYPILFNALFPNDTRYAPGFGSQVDYGDANEAAILIGWVGQQLADIYGQAAIARAHWPYYRYALRYLTVLDDYAFHSGSCRETGVGAWIDMLNGEFAGMLAYARLAELAGDKDMADQCRYRAAKRMLPTLARLYPGEEAETILPELAGKSWQLTGFGDDGPKTLYFPTDNGNFRGANDLFDFSQGIPGTLLALYFKAAAEPLREHLEKRAWPALTEGETRYFTFNYLPPLGLYRNDPDSNVGYAREALKCQKMMRDWPDMARPFQMGCILWGKYGRIAFSRVEKVELHTAYYEPASRRLVIECRADAESVLCFRSAMKPQKCVRNGQKVKLTRSGESFRLPLQNGRMKFEITF